MLTELQLGWGDRMAFGDDARVRSRSVPIDPIHCEKAGVTMLVAR
jgi:hypothetical protein